MAVGGLLISVYLFTFATLFYLYTSALQRIVLSFHAAVYTATLRCFAHLAHPSVCLSVRLSRKSF